MTRVFSSSFKNKGRSKVSTEFKSSSWIIPSPASLRIWFQRTQVCLQPDVIVNYRGKEVRWSEVSGKWFIRWSVYRLPANMLTHPTNGAAGNWSRDKRGPIRAKSLCLATDKEKEGWLDESSLVQRVGQVEGARLLATFRILFILRIFRLHQSRIYQPMRSLLRTTRRVADQ